MSAAYADTLTNTERSEADQLEAAILRDLPAFDRASMVLDGLESDAWEAFLRCGRNLLRFRAGRLYRPESWEAWCLRQLTYTKSTIDRRLRRFEVLASLLGGQSEPKGLLLNERQARALYPTPEDERPAVLDAARQSAAADGRRVTAGDISNVEAARKAGLDPSKYAVQPRAKAASGQGGKAPRSPVEGAVVCVRKAVDKIRWAAPRLDAGPQETIERGLRLVEQALDDQA